MYSVSYMQPITTMARKEPAPTPKHMQKPSRMYVMPVIQMKSKLLTKNAVYEYSPPSRPSTALTRVVRSSCKKDEEPKKKKRPIIDHQGALYSSGSPSSRVTSRRSFARPAMFLPTS